MRVQKESDFFVELPDVGNFRFGRRTFLDRAKIRADYLRIVKEFDTEDNELAAYASIMASHKIMCVEAPKGWEDIQELVLTPDVDKKVFELYELVSQKTDNFLKDTDESSKTKG